ncbi:hypothetical protein [Endomicrobium proavitum]|uniref:Lipoprotein n=1 Tax=Endomicrobium proavitum TaxID=1408281 RepID=A0A0G3WJF9_9BACT|nr:hypothetical protein [Endomicrobium proavitum]AKL97629.1 exported protein of unknown function [Endomicrobium proavitum]
MKKLSLAAVFFIFLSACAANRAVVKSDYNFSAVKVISVGNFTADAAYPSSGNAVKNSVMKYLLAMGYTVVANNKTKADAVVSGSVTTYLPNKKYLVRMPDYEKINNHHGQTVIYGGADIMEVGGSNVYDLGTAFGLGEDNRVIASNATVGISAYMTDAETGEVVWSDSYTYEGLDLSSALDGAVKYILKTIPKVSIQQEGSK